MANLIEHNPLLKESILKVLSISEQNPGGLRAQIEEAAAETMGEKFTLQSPATVVDILIRNEALHEELYVDGELYGGTLTEVQTDASIEDGATIEQYLTITASGEELLNEYAGDKQIRALLAERPQYTQVYMTMLETCMSDMGVSRSDVEDAIQPLLVEGAEEGSGAQRIYPQYFIDSLETAGGITWQGSWHTTDVGKAVVRAQQ